MVLNLVVSEFIIHFVHEIAPIAIAVKFNVYGLIMDNFIILCIFKSVIFSRPLTNYL